MSKTTIEDQIKNLATAVKDAKFDKTGISALSHEINLKHGEIKRLDISIAELRAERDKLKSTIQSERSAQLQEIDKRLDEARRKDSEAQTNVENTRKIENMVRLEKQKVIEDRTELEDIKREIEQKSEKIKGLAKQL